MRPMLRAFPIISDEHSAVRLLQAEEFPDAALRMLFATLHVGGSLQNVLRLDLSSWAS